MPGVGVGVGSSWHQSIFSQ